MTKEKCLGIWMDHASANLIALKDPIETINIVVAFNQHLVENSEDLALKVKNTPVDTWVDFEIIRHGERQVIKIKTGHNPKS